MTFTLTKPLTAFVDDLPVPPAWSRPGTAGG
jgi:hypothetical protein